MQPDLDKTERKFFDFILPRQRLTVRTGEVEEALGLTRPRGAGPAVWVGAAGFGYACQARTLSGAALSP